jgi:hypothetical protein
MDWIKAIENILYYFVSFIAGIAIICSVALVGVMIISNLIK